MTDLILDLAVCRDPAVAGAKAAWLARARNAGLPILPGVVIPAEHSVPTMEVGLSVLAERGPGGARLAMAQHPLAVDVSDALSGAVRAMGVPAIVRSSSILEDNGEWAGAFESFAAVRVEDVEPAVRSCWASTFTTSTLMRAEEAGMAPGSVPMAILIQPLIEPELGGIARLVDGGVAIDAVRGSPARLLGGVDAGSDELERPDDAIEQRVADILRRASDELGATSCEWAMVDGDLFVLQLKRVFRPRWAAPPPMPRVDHQMAGRVAQIVRRVPGDLGRRLLLPWALGADVELLETLLGATPVDIDPVEALDQADDLARALTSEVWDMSRPMAWDTAMRAIGGLTEPDARPTLDMITGLKPPDPERAHRVMGLVARVRQALAALWQMQHPWLAWYVDITVALQVLSGQQTEPSHPPDPLGAFDHAVIDHLGRNVVGVPAAPGRGSGRGCFIADPTDLAGFRPRDVVVVPDPTREIAPLMWRAAGIVTTGGAPAAHLFEVARALGTPAVCGVDIEALDHDGVSLRQIAIDGSTGSVSSLAW